MKKTHDKVASVQLMDATLQLGGRTLWQELSLRIEAGEFVAILGPNGAGKTTLLKVLLGLLPLTHGSADILGVPAKRGNSSIGYVPQQKDFDRSLPIRGRDLIGFGLNGYKYGLRKNKDDSAAVSKAIKAVGASSFADKAIGMLSGGEQQRLRIAQALVGEPGLLFCDEPLLSLDVASQATVTELIDSYRRRTGAAVLFVTHEINPVLNYVDRILYLANGQWIIDTPEAVLQPEVLSKLYSTQVEVLRIKNRVLVVGAEDVSLEHGGHHQEQT